VTSEALIDYVLPCAVADFPMVFSSTCWTLTTVMPSSKRFKTIDRSFLLATLYLHEPSAACNLP